MKEYEFRTRHIHETITLGKTMGETVFPGAVILFFGDLGAGKTALVSGMAEGLGSTDRVSSPTYTLMHQYQGKLNLCHFDLYRLSTDDDFYDIGAEEYLSDSYVCAIEWPQKCIGAMPEDRLEVHLSFGDSMDDRVIKLVAKGTNYNKWLMEMIACLP